MSDTPNMDDHDETIGRGNAEVTTPTPETKDRDLATPTSRARDLGAEMREGDDAPPGPVTCRGCERDGPASHRTDHGHIAPGHNPARSERRTMSPLQRTREALRNGAPTAAETLVLLAQHDPNTMVRLGASRTVLEYAPKEEEPGSESMGIEGDWCLYATKEEAATVIAVLRRCRAREAEGKRFSAAGGSVLIEHGHLTTNRPDLLPARMLEGVKSVNGVPVNLLPPATRDAFGPDSIPAPTTGSEAQPTAPPESEDDEWIEI